MANGEVVPSTLIVLTMIDCAEAKVMVANSTSGNCIATIFVGSIIDREKSLIVVDISPGEK